MHTGQLTAGFGPVGVGNVLSGGRVTNNDCVLGDNILFRRDLISFRGQHCNRGLGTPVGVDVVKKISNNNNTAWVLRTLQRQRFSELFL